MFNRFHLYQQLEQADCGLACIRMIAHHFGNPISMSDLRAIADINRLGITVGEIVSICSKIGLKATAAKIPLERIVDMPLPAILFWDERHYVVLYRISRNGTRFHIADPERGKYSVSFSQFAEHWNSGHFANIAILAGPTAEFYATHREPESVVHKLLHLVRTGFSDNRKAFVSIIGLSLLTMLADIATPYVFQQTIDSAINSADIALVWLLALGQLALFAGSYISTNISQVLFTRLGLKLGIEMTNQYLRKLIMLPLEFFDRKIGADLIQKVQDQERLKDFLVSTPNTIFFTLLNLLVFSAILIWYDLRIFVIMIILSSVNIIWTTAFLRKRRQIDYEYFTNLSKNRNNLYELINGMPEIKSNNAQQIRMEVWNKIQLKINRLAMQSTMMKLYLNGGVAFVARVRDLVITALCATLVINGSMTLGMMMAVSYIAGRVAAPLSSLLTIIEQVQDAAISYQRLEEILNYAKPQNFDRPFTAGTDIKLSHIIFKYPGANLPNAINNLSLIIPAGKTTAIVGESGCGKSTLLKIIAGFYTPVTGSIFIGNTPLCEINPDNWLQHCGIVMQDGYIFSDTILHNIALNKENPAPDRVQRAAQLACLHQFITSCPAGYDTRIGQSGLQLSGGQRQRLLIARAFYKNPSVLMFDEATSSLDATTEHTIINNITSFGCGRTVIIAAHRLSTITNADNIVVMDKGLIVEQGTHQQLISARGKYFQLIRSQLSS